MQRYDDNRFTRKLQAEKASHFRNGTCHSCRSGGGSRRRIRKPKKGAAIAGCSLFTRYDRPYWAIACEKPSTFCHAPRVKSGISTGRLPLRTEASVSSASDDHSAAS